MLFRYGESGVQAARVEGGGRWGGTVAVRKEGKGWRTEEVCV